MTLLGQFALWAALLLGLWGVGHRLLRALAGPAGARRDGRCARSTPCSAASWWRRSRCGRGSSATTSTSSTWPPTPAATCRRLLHLLRVLGGAEGLAPVLGGGALALRQPGAAADPAALRRPHAVRRGRDLGGGGVLRERHAVRLESVRAAALHAGRRARAQPAAAERRDGHPPADALPRLHQHHHPVRLRHRRAALAAGSTPAGSTRSGSGRW